MALDFEGGRSTASHTPDLEEKIIGNAREAIALGGPWFQRESHVGYRSAGHVVIAPPGQGALTRLLQNEPLGPMDAAPLALAVIGETRADGFGEVILNLTLSPNPVTAAFARATARRIGISAVRSRTLHEVASFYPEAGLERLAHWSEEELRLVT